MKLSRISIENFRGIQSICFEPDQNINVIVGPNAIGKTTLLEAIRFVKSLLAPRYYQETHQTLISLGALSPHYQFQSAQGSIDFNSIANDQDKPILIDIDMSIDQMEYDTLSANSGNIAHMLTRNKMGRGDDQSQFALTQYLSTKDGQTLLQQNMQEVSEHLESIKSSKRLKLHLVFDNKSHSHYGKDAFSQTAVSFLDAHLPTNKTKLSYFPADRAFPHGETNIQIGSADSGNQIQSYIGQPGTKYQRLKQTIVQEIITNRGDRPTIDSEFQTILENLLPGKSLHGIEINQLGLFKVYIKDQRTGKIFDIDSMSSGEKGIILTFLLIRQTLASGGILLIDEPELHLNPAVCKNLLPFLHEHCVKTLNIQTFLCTHSPEVLGSAFDRDDSNLFHLRSGTDLTKILRRDQFEMFEALKRLGATTADVLFSRGNIFVEGDHDIDILTEGFFDTISGFKVTKLGGRQEVEKEIQNLQQAEKKGEVDKVQLFIFDLDERQTTIQSTSLVKVKQWDRRCLENYLLDENIMFDLIVDNSKNKPESRGSFSTKIKELAMNQLTDFVSRKAYNDFEPDNPGMRPSETRGKDFSEIANILIDRIFIISSQVKDIDKTEWTQRFISKCMELMDHEKDKWDRDWKKVCDGKRLIIDLYKTHQINIDMLSFKKRIIKTMLQEQTEAWRVIQSHLSEALI